MDATFRSTNSSPNHFSQQCSKRRVDDPHRVRSQTSLGYAQPEIDAPESASGIATEQSRDAARICTRTAYE
jgi:hypothetical protein